MAQYQEQVFRSPELKQRRHVISVFSICGLGVTVMRKLLKLLDAPKQKQKILFRHKRQNCQK